MAMKNSPSRTPLPRHTGVKGSAISQTSPCTLPERLQRIEALGLRIAGYVRFMCELGECTGSSTEAKEKVVTAFYERIIVVERELAKIQEEFQLE